MTDALHRDYDKIKATEISRDLAEFTNFLLY